MSDETIDPEVTSVTVRQRDSVLLVPVMDVRTAVSRLHEFQEFCSSYLVEDDPERGIDGDYGLLPGTKKKSLRKSGADKLCEIYGLYDEYVVMARIEDWDRGLFDYEFKCVLKSRRDDSIVGTGMGSCSTFESKYRWRDSQRLCPNCKQPTIIKGKDFKGDGKPTGWLCFAKKGGCGARFKDGEVLIEGQTIGRVQNPDIADMKNTVLKMAKKRAKVDAVIGVTRSSGIFTQDVEDLLAPPVDKKEYPVTTEDVTIGKPKEQATATAQPLSGPAILEQTLARAHVLPKGDVQPDPEVIGADCIGMGEAANFHRTFKDNLREDLRKQADELAHDWLRVRELKDAIGKPSALAIKKDMFLTIREAAAVFARSL
jgi:hypothetical protein